MNLWPPENVVEALTPVSTTRRLQEAESASQCDLAATGPGDIGAIVFVGNLVLFAGALLAIFLLHVLLASGVEAYWLTKVIMTICEPRRACSLSSQDEPPFGCIRSHQLFPRNPLIFYHGGS